MPSPYQSGHNQENKTAINREFHKIGDLSNGRVEKPTGDRWLEPRSDNSQEAQRGERNPCWLFTPSAPPSGQIQAQPGNTAWWGGGGAGGQRPAGEG